MLDGKRVRSGFVYAPLNIENNPPPPPPQKEKVLGPPDFRTPAVQVAPSVRANTSLIIPTFGDSFASLDGQLLNQNIKQQIEAVLRHTVDMSPKGEYLTGQMTFQQLVQAQDGIRNACLSWANNPDNILYFGNWIVH